MSALSESSNAGGFTSFVDKDSRRTSGSGFVSSTASESGSNHGYTDQRVLEMALAAELGKSGRPVTALAGSGGDYATVEYAPQAVMASAAPAPQQNLYFEDGLRPRPRTRRTVDL